MEQRTRCFRVLCTFLVYGVSSKEKGYADYASPSASDGSRYGYPRDFLVRLVYARILVLHLDAWYVYDLKTLNTL